MQSHTMNKALQSKKNVDDATQLKDKNKVRSFVLCMRMDVDKEALCSVIILYLLRVYRNPP